MNRRENTFRIDLSNVPRKPSHEEVHEFVNTELGLQKEQVVRIQPSRSLQCVFVKVIELSIAQRIVAEHDNKHETEIDGKMYKLRIRLEDGAVEVKLHDLSEDVSDGKIVEYLRAYGDVISIRELMWDERYTFGGIPTGVREVKMMVKENIPSYVTIDGEITALSYYGQQQTCRHCSEFVHNGISCVQNKKLLVQKLNADQSYAKVVKQQSNPKIARPIPIRQNTNTQKTNHQQMETISSKTQLAPPKPITQTLSPIPSQSGLKIQPQMSDTAQVKPTPFKMPLRSTQKIDTTNRKTTPGDRERDGKLI